ncbi:hypothetical protein [Aeromicrobium sp. IC_218]|uniref:hypothetical protein n=1 Tax=Aeromicrobium sp. IC_218 TaxID=2545468 RepID=UPI00103F73A8|nr:hypothetical protein [Aeromicrobium sp. IC_218]TCI99724.1 hypothetical protein E0W78_04760 [Aeromicrobium sp. IC_218]
MRLIPALTAAALAAITVLGTGTAAHAEQTSITDKRADVLVTSFSSSDDDDYERLDAAASKKSGIDAKGVRFKHGKKSVTITAKFSRLKSGSTLYVEFYKPGRRSASFTLYGADGSSRAQVLDRDFDRACTAKLRTRNGKNGSITATVKRSCLDDMPKIRMAAAAYRFVPKGDDDITIYGDMLSSKKILTPEKSRLVAAS